VVLIEAWKTVVLRRYAQFTGRAGRAEYWWFVLANLIVVVVLGALSRASVLFEIIYLLYALAVLIPGIAVAVRRLHDTNRTGWWLLIWLVPLVGFIILIVFLATDGDRAPNRYGPTAPALTA
jgi:uncharacterized membrane protein YhaH (DUF805 family)